MSTTTTAKERPIIFSAPMVLAILEGRMTQTRRVVKPPPWWEGMTHYATGNVDENSITRTNMVLCEKTATHWKYCPHGQPGDRLWVRETFWVDAREPLYGINPPVIYAATPEWYKAKLDGVRRCTYLPRSCFDAALVTREESQANLEKNRFWRKRPSIFLPRWASRITLEIVSVRVERLKAISPRDAWAEGARCECMSPVPACKGNIDAFRKIWESIHGEGSWDLDLWNWFWVIEFRRLEEH